MFKCAGANIAFACGLAIVSLVAGNAAAADLNGIETRLATLRIDARTGDLKGVEWKEPRVAIIREPRLGENFRILLPRPDYEANYFNSSEQQVSRVERGQDEVTCVYDSLRNAREKVDVSVRYRIRAVHARIEFSIEVANRTNLPLAEVFFGIVGGQQGLVNRLETESLVPGVNANLAPGMFQNFRAGGYGGGNLGIRYSATGFLYPGAMTMSWLELYNRKADVALYYADQDPDTRLSALVFELRPFNKTAVIGDNWPTDAEVPAGEPIGLTMGWLKFPYTRKATFRSGAVALQVHRGDWHEGSRLYRQWFDQHFPVQRPASWLRKEMAWQSIIILSPEDVIVHRFRDLPRLAADAKQYGVTTFEILGWDMGGIDRGYPQYRPDPRLGTREEFRQALAEIKRLGVHPLIFANVQVADTSTEQYRESLHQYTVQKRWAEDPPIMGWGESTIGARLGLARRNMTLVSPAHPVIRRLLTDQFTELARDGAEGLQLDKTVIQNSLDFNVRLPVSPDRSLTAELLATFRGVLEAARKVNPRFALASEIFWDRAFPLVDVSYVRMNEIDMPSPALRYTFPEWTSTIFAENPGDFNVMNNGMRYGLVWALAPRHYNDSMAEPLTRPLSEYVRELIRIRSRHAELLFHGRFRDTSGAEVKAGPNVRYSVFDRMDGTRKGCVVVNFGNSEATAVVNWDGGRSVEVNQPFQPDRAAALPVQLRLAPRTCAVVAEK